MRGSAAVLKGPMSTPQGGGYSSPNIDLRKALGIYVNIRIARALPNTRTRFPETDIVVARELTEDLYNGAQQRLGPDAGMATQFVTRAASERAVRATFDWARRNGRRRLTIVHKASILKRTDGLMLEAARAIAVQFPGIECDDLLIDAAAMHLVREPERFDVIFTGYHYGDILSDLTAGLAGGVGLSPGMLIGDTIAAFEAVHGSAPRYAGMNKANPTGLILSGAMMLTHLGEFAAAECIRDAVGAVYRDANCLTYDQGGKAGTREFARAVAERVAATPA